nr:MAG TPA: hypothetical protein [Caudoviricetes sp.]
MIYHDFFPFSPFIILILFEFVNMNFTSLSFNSKVCGF